MGTRAKKPKAPAIRKRRFIRFNPDDGTLALVDLNPTGPFKISFTGLTVDEAYGGGCFVMVRQTGVRVGAKIRVKVGPLSPLVAVVRWIERPDPRLFIVGFEFLE